MRAKMGIKDLKRNFWKKVNKNGPIMPNMDTPCWEWTKCRNNWNYGVTSFGKGRTMGAHKKAWIITNGEVPDGYQVLHKCDNPPCCNPSHLFIGTANDNVQDAMAKGRRKVGFTLTGKVEAVCSQAPIATPMIRVSTLGGEYLNNFPTLQAVARYCVGVDDLWEYSFLDERQMRYISWIVIQKEVEKLCAN